MPRKVISIPVQAAVSDVGAAGADSSPRYDSGESLSVLVGDSLDGSSAGSDASRSTPPAMHARSSDSRSASPSHETFSASLVAGNAATLATSPTVIVRTGSVRRGRRKSFEMKTVTVSGVLINPPATDPEEFSSHGEFSSGKRLRKQLSGAIRETRKSYFDLSQRWDDLSSEIGARTKPIPGLLEAGSGKSITIDLSNYRPAALREGAIARIEKKLTYKDWRQAFKDVEVGLLVETLIAELERSSAKPGQMPELELVCRDQPLLAAVYPLVKCLALNAESLRRLKRLDLSRFSRCDDVCEAHLPTDEVRIEAYDKFIDRLAQLLEDSPSLRELGLRMNGVDSFALAEIADALAENKVLERLDLSANPLCMEASEARPSRLGIRALAEALRKRSALKNLDLSFCGLKKHAANILVQALAHNVSLEQINLGGNPIPPLHPIFKDKRVVRIVSIKAGE